MDYEFGGALKKKRKMEMAPVEMPAFSDIAEEDKSADLEKPLDSSYEQEDKPIEKQINQTGKDFNFISKDMDMENRKERKSIVNKASSYMKQSNNHLPSAYSAAKKAGDVESSKKFMEMMKKQAARKTPGY